MAFRRSKQDHCVHLVLWKCFELIATGKDFGGQLILSINIWSHRCIASTTDKLILLLGGIIEIWERSGFTAGCAFRVEAFHVMNVSIEFIQTFSLVIRHSCAKNWRFPHESSKVSVSRVGDYFDINALLVAVFLESHHRVEPSWCRLGLQLSDLFEVACPNHPDI